MLSFHRNSSITKLQCLHKSRTMRNDEVSPTLAGWKFNRRQHHVPATANNLSEDSASCVYTQPAAAWKHRSGITVFQNESWEWENYSGLRGYWNIYHLEQVWLCSCRSAVVARRNTITSQAAHKVCREVVQVPLPVSLRGKSRKAPCTQLS